VTVVKVRPYTVGDAPAGLELVEVDTVTGAVRTLVVDYQQPGRDLHLLARSHAILHGIEVAP
jgi:hypothetical protein